LIILAGLLVALLAVGYLSVRLSPKLALFGAVMPLALVIAIQMANRMDFWVVGILGAAGFVRFTLPTGTQSEIVASMLLTGVSVVLWLMKMLVIDKQLQLKAAPTNLPILGFIGTAILSLVWGIAFRDPLVVAWGSFPFVQIASLAVMMLLPGAFLLVGNCVEDWNKLKVMVGLIFVIGTLGLGREFWGVSVRVNVLGIFPMWCAAIAYALALFNAKMPWWQRVLLLLLAVGWLWYGYPRRITWLAAWIPTFIALGIVSVMRFRWSLVIVLIVFALVGWRYVQINYGGEMAESGQTRLAAWRQNWEVTGKHLLFGTGPAGYAAYYMSYFPTAAMATHSNFVDILSQTGVVGLFFCLWFLGALLWQGYRLTRRLNGRSDFAEGVANAAFAGTAGCVVAMAIGDWMFPFAYTQTIAGFDYVVYNWLLIGMIPALEFVTLRGDLDSVRREL
jgi:hypothetical protein